MNHICSELGQMARRFSGCPRRRVVKLHLQRPSEMSIEVVVAGGLIHTVILRRSKGSGVPPSKSSSTVRVWGFWRASVEPEREGRQDIGVIRIRALREVLTMLGHGVGQLRDAGDDSSATRSGSCFLRSEDQRLRSSWGRSTWGRPTGILPLRTVTATVSGASSPATSALRGIPESQMGHISKIESITYWDETCSRSLASFVSARFDQPHSWICCTMAGQRRWNNKETYCTL